MIPRHGFALLRGADSVGILLTTFPAAGPDTYRIRSPPPGNSNSMLPRSFSISPTFSQKESLITILRNDVNAYKNVSKDMIHQKYNDAYSFYEQFSHMDEVREAHDKVIAIQDNLHVAQKRRCELMTELIGIRSKQQMIAGEMSNSSKSDYRYLELVKLSIEANQSEKEKLEAYHIEDQQERSLFSHLMAAVKASHEKEKIYANTVKYWSIIGSLLSAAVGAFGAALSYHYRQNTYKTLTDKYTDEVISINTHVDAMKNELSDLKLEIKSARLTMQRESEFAVKHRTATSAPKPIESWSGFLWRKTVDVYRYIIPRSSSGSAKRESVLVASTQSTA